LSRRPKNFGPFQRVPVIAKATFDGLGYARRIMDRRIAATAAVKEPSRCTRTQSARTAIGSKCFGRAPPTMAARGLDLAEQLPSRQVYHRHRAVFLILGVEPLTVRRNDQAMAVGRPRIDGVHYLIGRMVDHRDRSAILARDVDQAVRREPQRMRRDIGPEVDITNMGALLEIDDAKKMTWIGIAAVNTVAEDRYISEVGIAPSGRV
jgi:hypothetical protein